MQSFLEGRRFIYADAYNLTGQTLDADRGLEGPYPDGTYVSVVNEKGERYGGVVRGRRNEDGGLFYGVQGVRQGRTGGHQFYGGVEELPASHVQLSAGSLTGKGFTAFILITLRAWRQWGWRYYKGEGRAEGSRNRAGSQVASWVRTLGLPKVREIHASMPRRGWISISRHPDGGRFLQSWLDKRAARNALRRPTLKRRARSPPSGSPRRSARRRISRRPAVGGAGGKTRRRHRLKRTRKRQRARRAGA